MKKPGKMISIWTWSAAILALYGVLLLAVGVYRLAFGIPGGKVLAELHADIWWPAVMIIFSLPLFVVGRREERASEEKE